jgi:hypothetical protein
MVHGLLSIGKLDTSYRNVTIACDRHILTSSYWIARVCGAGIVIIAIGWTCSAVPSCGIAIREDTGCIRSRA